MDHLSQRIAGENKKNAFFVLFDVKPKCPAGYIFQLKCSANYSEECSGSLCRAEELNSFNM